MEFINWRLGKWKEIELINKNEKAAIKENVYDDVWWWRGLGNKVNLGLYLIYLLIINYSIYLNHF